MKYVTVDEMRTIDRESDKHGQTFAMLMDCAGKGVAEIVNQKYGSLTEKRVLGIVGAGHNGGDTVVACSYLLEWGWKATIYIVLPRPEDDPLITKFKSLGGQCIKVDEDPEYQKLNDLISSRPILLDGVLGTGVHLPLRGNIPDILGRIRENVIDKDIHVVAIDCPSGVDCDTGDAAEECIPAEITATMAAIKQGLLRFPAYNYVGEIQVVDIGVPKGLAAYDSIRREVVDCEMVKRCLPERPLNAHKGTFGTALVVAGSTNYTGAALLASEAAYRIGAGLVTAAVPASIHIALAGSLPEATWILLPHEMGVINSDAVKVINENIDRVTAMLFGPGFGMDDATAEFVSRLVDPNGGRQQAGLGFLPTHDESSRVKKVSLPPLVIDADGLKLLARVPQWYKRIPSLSILTPHPGEMAVLTGMKVEDIQADRVHTAEKYAHEWGHIVVLKGAHTVIASPDGHTAVIPIASPALARAGTGDVLAGLIVGLRAQGVDAFHSSIAGVWIHAQAGLRAAMRLGSTAAVLAGDVLGSVVDVLGDLEIKRT
ncbi:MAG TPA: NAD(P)H-hydrate dehydratase [Anaerolineae bacterium]|nr:NAD(P)H-hydrate dehydratase [Anaerolineae bacterium]